MHPFNTKYALRILYCHIYFKPDLSGRSPCHRDAALQTKTLPFGAFALSAETRLTDLCGFQTVARAPPRKRFIDTYPTTAGVDGDVGAFTPLPGWAECLTSGEEQPVARQPAHAVRNYTTLAFRLYQGKTV